jgi:hypothetical protein
MDGEPDPLHDVRDEDRRTHELLEQILERLPVPEPDRRRALLVPIAAVVRGEAFKLASVYAFAEQSGAHGDALRQALAGLSPKSCGRLLSKWAAGGPYVVRESESNGDGFLWRIVGADYFEKGKSPLLQREKLGSW